MLHALRHRLPLTESHLGRLLLLWLLVRTAAWAVVTWAASPNAPLDVVEMLSWGHDWQWGYPKHPPLPAWIAEAAWTADRGTLLGVYFAGYAMTALTVWAVWRLAVRVVPPRDALLAALCLEGVVFYTFWGHELNNNVVLTPFWALTALFVFRAVEDDRARDWLLAGACAGLGLLAKYALAFLLLPLLVWMIVEPRARRMWRRPGPYLAVAAMLAVFGPHLVWAVRNDWPTLAYARNRTDASEGTWNRVVQPLSFLANQALALIPLIAVLLWGLARRAREATEATEASEKERFAVRFLIAVVGGPLLIHLLLGAGMGMQLKGPWGTPIWAFAGVLAVVLWRVRPADGMRRAMGAALVACNVAALAFLAGQAAVWSSVGKTPSRIHFPGRDFAAQADGVWRERHGGPVPAVAGDQWLAGNVGLYAPDRPRVCYGAADNDAHLHRHGGLVVWQVTAAAPTMPPTLRLRYPAAVETAVLPLNYGRNTVLVGLAVVPPAAVESSSR